MAVYANPHIIISVHATGVGDFQAAGAPNVLDIQHSNDLGNYTLSELEDLLTKMKDRLDAWIVAHPPHEG
jgi:hypothetical protein